MMGVAVEVIVDVEGIQGGVKSAKKWFEAQALLGLGHQGEKVSDVSLIVV